MNKLCTSANLNAKGSDIVDILQQLHDNVDNEKFFGLVSDLKLKRLTSDAVNPDWLTLHSNLLKVQSKLAEMNELPFTATMYYEVSKCIQISNDDKRLPLAKHLIHHLILLLISSTECTLPCLDALICLSNLLANAISNPVEILLLVISIACEENQLSTIRWKVMTLLLKMQEELTFLNMMKEMYAQQLVAMCCSALLDGNTNGNLIQTALHFLIQFIDHDDRILDILVQSVSTTSVVVFLTTSTHSDLACELILKVVKHSSKMRTKLLQSKENSNLIPSLIDSCQVNLAALQTLAVIFSDSSCDRYTVRYSKKLLDLLIPQNSPSPQASDDIGVEALKLLSWLVLKRDNRALIVEQKDWMVRNLLTSFHHAFETLERQCLALDVLKNMCMYNSDIQVYFTSKESGVLPILLQLLQQPSPLRPPDLRLKALEIIWGTAKATVNKSFYVSEEGNIVSILLEMIEDENNNTSALQQEERVVAIGILWNLASVDEIKLYLASDEVNLLPLLVKVLRHNGHEEVIIKVLGLLWTMSNHPVIKLRLATESLGFLPLFLVYCRHEHNEIQTKVLAVLENLSERIETLEPIKTELLPVLLSIALQSSGENFCGVYALEILLALTRPQKFLITPPTCSIDNSKKEFYEDSVNILDILSEALGKISQQLVLLQAPNIDEQSHNNDKSLLDNLSFLHSYCCIEKQDEVIHIILDAQFSIVEKCTTILATSHVDEEKVKSAAILWTIAESGGILGINQLLQYQTHIVAMEVLQMNKYKYYDNIVAKLLNLLMNMARFLEAKSSLLSTPNLVSYMLNLYDNKQDSSNKGLKQIQGQGHALKALVILLFLFGSQEIETAERAGQPIIISDSHLSKIYAIITLTLQSRGGNDFTLGTFCLPLLMQLLLVISQSDSNKTKLIAHDFIPLITATLRLFALKQQSIPNCGGGRDDHETASLCIEIMLQLSFCEDQSLFSSVAAEQEVVQMLVLLVKDERLTTDEQHKCHVLISKLTINNLNNRYGEVDLITTNVAVDDQPKHVMISYSWHSSANPQLVKQLASSLRGLGHDVWRDEDGSTLVPPMSQGSVDDRMAAAIEESEAMIICVSMAYKLSSNCRLEAQYASQLVKRNKLRLIFVMMNEDYTTVSHPDYCDGWLGILVGNAMWYGMWTEEEVVHSAQQISATLSDLTRIGGKRSIMPVAVQQGAMVRSQSMLMTRTVSMATSSRGVSEAMSRITDDVQQREIQIQRQVSSFSPFEPPSTSSQSAAAAFPVSTTAFQDEDDHNEVYTKKAWAILINKAAVKEVATLQQLLAEEGVLSNDDLLFCSEELLLQIADCLRNVQRQKFLHLVEKLRPL